jgi:hypothetical protein
VDDGNGQVAGQYQPTTDQASANAGECDGAALFRPGIHREEGSRIRAT